MNKSKNDKSKKTKHNFIKIILILFVIVLILGTAVFSAYLVKSKGDVVDATIKIVTDVVGEQDPIFGLILGVSEDLNTTLTDTIILAGYNPTSQKAFLLSIPRDTFIGKNKFKANGNDKINSLFQKDCIKTIDAVEKITGVKIDYYVVIKTKAFSMLVDSIGGVKFDVPINMNYDDITQNLHIHLKSGMQTLNGNQAEQLVRFRHNNNGSSYPISYGDNDFGRMRTQRDFIKALINQVVSLNNITNINSIATAIFDNVETNMPLSKILAYIPFGVNFNTENLETMQLPGESKIINDLWFYEVNYNKANEMLDILISELDLENSYLESHYKRKILTNEVNMNFTKEDNYK